MYYLPYVKYMEYVQCTLLYIFMYLLGLYCYKATDNWLACKPIVWFILFIYYKKNTLAFIINLQKQILNMWIHL